MNKAELHRHPAYRELTVDEQRTIDGRLDHWNIDVNAIAASTGSLTGLEASDLRFWLASTKDRPWAMITLCKDPARANALFDAFLAAAPRIAQHPRPSVITDALRELSRALAVAEATRAEVGFVRDEQLAALGHQIDNLEPFDVGLSDEVILGVIRSGGLTRIAGAIFDHRRSSTGMRGFFDRLGAKLRTRAFDIFHASTFVASGSPDHEGHFRDGVWRNWTAEYEVRPNSYRCPRSEKELAAVVAEARSVRVVGGGHSFNDSPLCADTLISLDDYDSVTLDIKARTARVRAGIRLRDLNKVLWQHGLGLPVLGSTDAQSIAGLIATDLHGTGRDHGFLSEQVLSMRVMAADGAARTVRRGDPLFHATFGALGTSGIVCDVELQLVPGFHVEKTSAMVDRAETEANIGRLLQENHHVSFYYVGGADESESIRVHTWNHVDAPLTPDWEKIKIRAELTDFALSAFAPSVAEALVDIDEDAWLSNVLVPDKRLVMPSSQGFGRKLFYRHDEIEYGVPLPSWKRCLAEVMEFLRARNEFSIVEVRFTPNVSQALLGPGVGRETAYIELATPMAQITGALYAEVEEIFLRHGGQPHLGKKTNLTASRMLQIFGDRFVQFQAVRAEQDPHGKFLNAFTRRVFGPELRQ